jgi:hypothetical protein
MLQSNILFQPAKGSWHGFFAAEHFSLMGRKHWEGIE